MAKNAVVVKLSDAEIETLIMGLNMRDLAKLTRFTRQEIGRMGYAGVREGNATWQTARRAVLEHLAGQGLTVSDVEEGEG